MTPVGVGPTCAPGPLIQACLLDGSKSFFGRCRARTDGAYSAKAIAARSTERGFRLGESYLSQLRSGKAKSPSFRTVEGIAAAFGVDVHYFLEDRAAQRTRDEIDLMRLQADTDVQLAAFRLAGLSSDSVTVVNELIKVLREQQGLPKDPPDVVAAGLTDDEAEAIEARLRVVGLANDD